MTKNKENIINMGLGAFGYSVSPSSEDEDYMNKMTKVKGKNFPEMLQQCELKDIKSSRK